MRARMRNVRKADSWGDESAVGLISFQEQWKSGSVPK
jgi:hypothetical protein